MRKECERYTDGTRSGYGGEYCWNRHKIFRNWHYIDVKHTNNYKKLDTSFEKIEKFIKNESLLLIKEFKSNISTYLNGYLGEIQSLYDSLNNYVNTKLNTHEELNSLITQYNLILNNMSEIADKDINLEKEQVELFLQEINNKTKDIKKEFFENYYLTNSSSYLEYPDEVLYKIINFGDELKLISEIVKKQIDYLVNRKIWRVREENHNYIRKKKDFFS